jgi:hypothetical protein
MWKRQTLTEAEAKSMGFTMDDVFGFSNPMLRLLNERTEILSVLRELTDEETLRLVQIENELGIT